MRRFGLPRRAFSNVRYLEKAIRPLFGSFLVVSITACSGGLAGPDIAAKANAFSNSNGVKIGQATDNGPASGIRVRTGKIPHVLAAVGSGVVTVYTQYGHLLIDQFYAFSGTGLAFDSNAALYVAGGGVCPGSPSGPGVAIYPAPWKTMSSCLPISRSSTPLGVAISDNGYVAAEVNSSGAAADVVIFPPGSSTACIAVTGAAFPILTGYSSFDSSGDLFVTGYRSVGEVKGLCRAKTISNLNLSHLSDPNGIRIDGAGNLDVLMPSGNQSVPSVIAEYRPGSKSPARTTTLNSFGGLDFVFAGKDIWGAGYPMFRYKFPAGGSPILPGIYPPVAGTTSVAAFPILTPGP